MYPELVIFGTKQTLLPLFKPSKENLQFALFIQVVASCQQKIQTPFFGDFIRF